MHWWTIWAWLRTWEGAVPAAVAVSAAIYYGPRKMLETWDWYLDRFLDRPVLNLIKDRMFTKSPNLRMRKGIPISMGEPTEAAYTAAYLAFSLHRSIRSISKSLERLYAQDKIEHYMEGWRLK
jgi:hypothetical protein